jgi:hypothetical protein
MYQVKNGYAIREEIKSVGGEWMPIDRVWLLTDAQYDTLYARYETAYAASMTGKGRFLDGFVAAAISRVTARHDRRNGVSESTEIDGYQVDGGEDN